MAEPTAPASSTPVELAYTSAWVGVDRSINGFTPGVFTAAIGHHVNASNRMHLSPPPPLFTPRTLGEISVTIPRARVNDGDRSVAKAARRITRRRIERLERQARHQARLERLERQAKAQADREAARAQAEDQAQALADLEAALATWGPSS